MKTRKEAKKGTEEGGEKRRGLGAQEEKRVQKQSRKQKKKETKNKNYMRKIEDRLKGSYCTEQIREGDK